MPYNVKTTFPKKRTAAQVAKGVLKKAIDTRRGIVPMSRMSALKVQALRTGGWANPQIAETKFIDNTASTTLATAAATFSSAILLNGCVQGTEAVNRLGRKIVMTSLYLKGTATLQAASTQGGYVRIMVVYDRQANGTAPAITDVLLADSSISPNNLSNRERFVKVIDHETQNVSTQGDFAVPFEIYRKLNLETNFNTGNAGTVGDITTGSLYMFLAQSASIATAGPVVNWRARVKFADP